MKVVCEMCGKEFEAKAPALRCHPCRKKWIAEYLKKYNKYQSVESMVKKKKGVRTLTLKNGLEVLDNALGRIMMGNDVVYASNRIIEVEHHTIYFGLGK